MAKRLSSIFSLSREDHPSAGGQPGALFPSPDATLVPSPSKQRLHKHKSASSSELNLAVDSTAWPPLAPPPLVTDAGVVRPPSGTATVSRPESRASSAQSREGSRSRPQTPSFLVAPGSAASPYQPGTPSLSKLSKKKSWFGGRSDKHREDDDSPAHSRAWIVGLQELVPYDLAPLLTGDRVLELWNDYGGTAIHLYPADSGRGASFKVDSSLFKDSSSLVQLRQQASSSPDLRGEPYRRIQYASSELSINMPDSQVRPRSRPTSSQSMATNLSVPKFSIAPREEQHIYLPLEFDGDVSSPGMKPQGDDRELVILYRNFFSFLSGGALVSTPRQSSLYSIFLGISSILKRFRFSDVDGSTWGEGPATSFARYCDELRLADVRSSREKTIEAIVLGEHMRSWSLYNEGFVHAVGRLDDIKSIRSPEFNKISSVTINRLERAYLDLEQRLRTVRTKLDDFEFPSMFAGIANSQTSTEGKLVRFKAWKASFLDFRRFTITYYKRKYGAWPPKASSKKNHFEESGLNRLLLKELYQDFTDLYDMLVDRASLTPRTGDVPLTAGDGGEANDVNETIQHALRQVESEYDRATPPVLPPIPFDTPQIPQFAHSFNREHVMIPKTSSATTRRLKDNEVNEVLLGSYNRESIKASTWIQDFFNYERRLNHGKSLEEIVDNRCGQWLFMYAVLQALPMTVVDARDVRYTEGVEDFLCIGPRGGRPWMKEDQSQSRAWDNVASGGRVVSLPADQIDHSVEGIYRRSHCWTVATKWAEAQGTMGHEVVPDQTATLQAPFSREAPSPYLSPQPSPGQSPHSSPLMQPISPSLIDRRWSQGANSSLVNHGMEGLAALPEQATRPVSVFNPNLTFDVILGTSEQRSKGKKGKK